MFYSTCKFCSGTNDGIPPAIPLTVCRSRACQEKYLAQIREQYYQQKEREQNQRQQHLRHVLQKHGLLEQQENTTPTAVPPAHSSDASLRYYSVPANLLPLVELPAERREKFLKHLQQVTDEAFSIEGSPSNQVEHSDSVTEAPPEKAAAVANEVSAACGTCQGYCCRHGGHNAFYTVAHIQTLRQTHPTYSAAQIIDLVASHLPAVSVQDSCVMHAAQGCQLPRELRANLCNSFECAELVHIVNNVDKSPMLIVAIEGEHIVRQTKYFPPSSTNDCRTDEEDCS